MSTTIETTAGPIAVLSVAVIIGVCVFILNPITFAAILRTPSLRRNHSNFFVLNLGLVDMMLMMCIITFKTYVMIQEDNPSQGACVTSIVVFGTISMASMLSNFAIAVDRFLFIHKAMTYTTIVTFPRTIKVIVSIWIMSLINGLIPLFGGITETDACVHPANGSLCTQGLLIVTSFLVTGVISTGLYGKLFLVIRKHNHFLERHALTHSRTHDCRKQACTIESQLGACYLSRASKVSSFCSNSSSDRPDSEPTLQHSNTLDSELTLKDQNIGNFDSQSKNPDSKSIVSFSLFTDRSSRKYKFSLFSENTTAIKPNSDNRISPCHNCCNQTSSQNVGRGTAQLHHDCSEAAPDRLANSETVADRLVNSETVTERNVNSETVPDRHLHSETAPDRHGNSQTAPDRHVNSETAPDRHGNNETAPGRHFNNETEPDIIVNSETEPNIHVGSESVPDNHVSCQTSCSGKRNTSSPARKSSPLFKKVPRGRVLPVLTKSRYTLYQAATHKPHEKPRRKVCFLKCQHLRDLRTIKTLMLMFAIHFICWTPIMCCKFVFHMLMMDIDGKWFTVAWIAGASNSLWNFAVYPLRKVELRRAIIKLLSSCLRCPGEREKSHNHFKHAKSASSFPGSF